MNNSTRRYLYLILLFFYIYIINRKNELEKVGKLIEDEKWAEILNLDELNRELAAGRVLHGYISNIYILLYFILLYLIFTHFSFTHSLNLKLSIYFRFYCFTA